MAFVLFIVVILKTKSENTVHLSAQSQDSGKVSQYPGALQSRNPSPFQGYPLKVSTPWSALKQVLDYSKFINRILTPAPLTKSTCSSYTGGAGPPLEAGLEVFPDWLVEFTEGGTSFLRAVWEEWDLWEAAAPLADVCDWPPLLCASFPPLQASLLSRAL